MPLYLDQLLDDLFTNKMVKKVVENPILTAIIIVLIFVIIAHFLFYDSEDDDAKYGKTLTKFGIYGFVCSLGVIFLHYKNTEDDLQKRMYGHTARNIIDQVHQVNESNDAETAESAEEPVKPDKPSILQPKTPAQTDRGETQAVPQVQVIVQQQPAPTPPRPVLRTPVDTKTHA